MRHLLALLAFAAPAGSAAAQGHWRSEIGIVGGFARISQTGTSQPAYTDRAELPGTGSLYPTLFVVIPLTARVALEPAIAASHTSFKEGNGLIPSDWSSSARVTLRANVALAAGLYAAAGGMIRYKGADALHDIQVGALGAVGYHVDLGSGLTGRFEIEWITQRRTDSIVPTNVLAFLLGLSRHLTAGASNPRARAGPWRLGVGMTGGYVRNHLYGSALGNQIDAHETFVNLPGAGSTALPGLFFVVPLRGPVAFETALGGQRTQQQGNTSFDGQLSTRLDFAIYRGGYVAAGGTVRYLEQTGRPGFGFAGAHIAAGYRFPLVGALDGRAEVSFTTFKERQNFPFAQNTLAVLLGATMGLD